MPSVRVDLSLRTIAHSAALVAWLAIIVGRSLAAAAQTSKVATELNEVAERFEAHEFANESASGPGDALKYRLLTPSPLVERRDYPLVLFLHGASDRGTDNMQQLDALPAILSEPQQRREYPCFLIAPQCRPGKDWDDERELVFSVLDEILEEYPVDPRRVYLTGYSMGGRGAWSLAIARPGLFAAVAPLCGVGYVNLAHRLVDVPVWAVHGDADEVIPVEYSRRMIRAIRQAGGSPKYTELEGVGHSCWPIAYTDPAGVVPWMFAQTKPLINVEWPVAALLAVDGLIVLWLAWLLWRNFAVGTQTNGVRQSQSEA